MKFKVTTDGQALYLKGFKNGSIYGFFLGMMMMFCLCASAFALYYYG